MPARTKYNVLIIDDSRAVHAFIKETLKVLDVELVSVFSGEDGIELFKKEAGFSFVLLDWEMPGLDGPATLAALRQIRPEIPVSMMTSRSSLEDIRQMLTLGAQEYIMKPFTKDILIAKVLQLAAGAQ